MKLFDRLNKLLRPAYEARFSGELTMALGCAACPNRKEVTAPSIGGLSIGGQVVFPWQVKQSVVCEVAPDVSSASLSAIPIVSINQTPCEGPCPFAEQIEEFYRGLSGEPSVLDIQFSPAAFVLKEGEETPRLERPQ